HIKILTYAPLHVRVERLAKRDGKSVEEALHEIKVRENSEVKRYKKYYEIDVNNLDVFDIILNTSLLSEEEATRVATEVIKVLAPLKFKKKEEKL
ncbi:MAG: cytidylate kinase family protein, partial [Sulfolobales archaeon]